MLLSPGLDSGVQRADVSEQPSRGAVDALLPLAIAIKECPDAVLGFTGRIASARMAACARDRPGEETSRRVLGARQTTSRMHPGKRRISCILAFGRECRASARK